MGDSCADARRELGVYVLGAIGPADRAVMERHLGACPRCRAELASMACLPALLRRVPEAETILVPGRTGQESAGVPPAALLSRLARLRRRTRVLAVAAAAAMIAGTAVAVSLASHDDARPQTVAAPAWQANVQAASPATGVRAAVRYAARPWGTQIEAHISGVPRGARCQLWVTDTRGQRVQAGGWVIAAGQAGFWYPGSSSLPATDLRSFQITSMGRILVTIPARGRPAQ
jgi:hypothetical protein